MLIKQKYSWQHLSNSARILRQIFRSQPISRSEIAEALGCPSSLVTSVTASLIEKGIIQELGKAEKTEDNMPGRKRLVLGICPDARYSIGVEIGIRHFRFYITNLSGHVLKEICYTPGEEQIAHVNNSIADGVSQLIRANIVPEQNIIGVGVALPGHLNLQSGHMVSHSSLWQDFNIGKLEAALGMKVTAENNVRSMAYEKYLFDSRSCPEDFALLHAGAGIFCAAFRSGILSEGGYTSGEIGHTIVNPNGLRCECGKAGCLQTYTSESWLLRKARSAYQTFPNSVFHRIVDSEDKLTLDHLLYAYQLGEPFAIQELREALYYLSIAAANSAIVLGVPKMYLNSRMFQNEMLRQEFLSFIEAQLSFVNNVCDQDIEILPFKSSRAAVGAAALAIDRLFISHCF